MIRGSFWKARLAVKGIHCASSLRLLAMDEGAVFCIFMTLSRILDGWLAKKGATGLEC